MCSWTKGSYEKLSRQAHAEPNKSVDAQSIGILINVDDPRYVCCRDALSRHESMAEESRLQYLKNLTDLLSHTFTGQFVYPVLGHEDVGLNFSQIANLWSNWLPDEALVTLRESECCYRLCFQSHFAINDCAKSMMDESIVCIGI